MYIYIYIHTHMISDAIVKKKRVKKKYVKDI